MESTTVKVTCNTGKSWVTRINTTPAEARRYFLGQSFTDENPETGEESVNTVVKVEMQS